MDTYPEGILLPRTPPPNTASAALAALATGVNNRSRFHGLQAYGQAKLCNVLFVAELARRAPPSVRPAAHSPWTRRPQTV